MPGPGEYRPDPTIGIARPEDLPKTKVGVQSRNYRRRPCPHCGGKAARDRLVRRTLHDLGNTLTGGPATSSYSFPTLLLPLPQVLQRRRHRPGRPRQPLHPPGRQPGRPAGRRGRLALSLCRMGPLARPSRVRPLRHDPKLGRGRGEKKAAQRVDTDHLDWALSDFSGFIAVDELYDDRSACC